MNQVFNTTSVDLDQAMALAIEQAAEVTQNLVRARSVSLDPWYTEEKLARANNVEGNTQGEKPNPKQISGGLSASILVFFDWLTQQNPNVSFAVKSSCLKSSVQSQLAHFQRRYERWRAGHQSKTSVVSMLSALRPEEILKAADTLITLSQGIQSATGWLDRMRNTTGEGEGGYSEIRHRAALAFAGHRLGTDPVFRSKSVSADQITEAIPLFYDQEQERIRKSIAIIGTRKAEEPQEPGADATTVFDDILSDSPQPKSRKMFR